MAESINITEANENRVYDRVKQERKSKLTTREEIGELRRKIKEHKILLEKENIEKTCQMKEMWRNRSQIIPVYRSPLLKVIADEEEKRSFPIRTFLISLLLIIIFVLLLVWLLPMPNLKGLNNRIFNANVRRIFKRG